MDCYITHYSCFTVYMPPFTMQSAAPEVEDSFDFLFKIILVGDSDVGKTCVVQRFKSGIFIEKQQNTIGVDFTVRTLDIDGKKVKVGELHWNFAVAVCLLITLFCFVNLCSVFIRSILRSQAVICSNWCSNRDSLVSTCFPNDMDM